MREIATVRSAALQPLLSGYLNQCHFAEPALIACGLSPDALADPESELPQFAVWNLVEHLARLEGNPLFAHDTVMQADAIPNPLSATQLLQYKGRPLELACSYIEALNNYTPQSHFWWKIVGDEFQIFRCPADPRVNEGLQVEYYALAVILRFLQTHIEDQLSPVRVTLRAPNRSIKATPSAWGNAVKLSSGQVTTMALPLGQISQCYEEIAGIINNYSTAQNNTSTDEAFFRFRKVVKSYMGRPGCSVDSLATALGLSSRTLQRRLDELGTSFSRVMDECRLEVAVEELSTGELSMEKISHKLGYNNPGDFTRAFKRWTGDTPTHFKDSVDLSPGTVCSLLYCHFGRSLKLDSGS
ncbi:MAG: helix-turn-helix domain-containing protein [Halioglobus sp.]